MQRSVNEKKDLLTQSEEPVNVKQLLSLALSAGGVQAMTAIVGIFTVKIVASLGGDALAAVTGGQRLYFVLQAIIMGLNVGSMALISRSYGEKNTTQALHWMRLSLLLTSAIALSVSMIFWLFPNPILQALGLNNDVLSLSVEYIQALSFFIWPIAVYLILAGALRAMNNAWIPLGCGIALNLLTLYLTYGYVHLWPDLSHSSTAGVAIAAGVGNTIGLGLVLILLVRRWRSLFLGRWSLDGLSRIWQISYPAMLEQILRQVSVLAFLWVVAQYGTAPYAAYGAGVMLMALSFVIGFGFSIATAVMVGQAVGKNNINLAKRILNTALLLALGLMSILGIVLAIYCNEFAVWLVGQGEVARYTAIFIFYFALLQPLMAIDFVTIGALQGTGDTRWPMLSVFISHLVIRFSIAFLLLKLEAPVEWVFATILLDYLIKTLMMCWRVFYGPWPRKH